MGDSIEIADGGVFKRPGVMIVRPSLHEQTEEKTATFKRWTIMHFRDLLNLAPASSDAKGISRTMRYTNTAGELFYTIHADDISIWKTPAYYAISRRLDLENTRGVEEGEQAVCPDFKKLGDEPMVWHLVNAEFGIFSEHPIPSAGQDGYQSVASSLLSAKGSQPSAPACVLITLTYSCVEDEKEDDLQEPPRRLKEMQSEILTHFSAGNTSLDGKIFSGIYRHIPSAQPDMHPAIEERAHGNGQWVVCVMIEEEVSEVRRMELKAGLEGRIDEKKRRGKKDGESRVDWEMRVGVWKGELFMG
ncbi:hypothetical protein EKO04_002193 [Ascochyta lentis]|uniref:Uncharacterized protein n=1 Tax=Ascochyta lentis TaxID=205686 RepID=A0A8H7JBN6_9PLEO|nr:hypothetical protein EKO04_002193 [Ascochyta lentis]